MAGFIIGALMEDSDLEVFIQHSEWGDEHFNTSESARVWSGDFKDWIGSPTVQFDAMINLLGSFDVGPDDDGHPQYGQVKLGLHDDDWELEIAAELKWKVGGSVTPVRAVWKFACGAPPKRSSPGIPTIELTEVVTPKEGKRRLVFSLEGVQPTGTAADRLVETNFAARLHVPHPKRQIPKSGSWAKARYKDHVWSTSSSKDIV